MSFDLLVVKATFHIHKKGDHVIIVAPGKHDAPCEELKEAHPYGPEIHLVVVFQSEGNFRGAVDSRN